MPSPWYEWRGGECPVEPNLSIEIFRYSDPYGIPNHVGARRADEWTWSWSHRDGFGGGDGETPSWAIVAFRIMDANDDGWLPNHTGVYSGPHAHLEWMSEVGDVHGPHFSENLDFDMELEPEERITMYRYAALVPIPDPTVSPTVDHIVELAPAPWSAARGIDWITPPEEAPEPPEPPRENPMHGLPGLPSSQHWYDNSIHPCPLHRDFWIDLIDSNGREHRGWPADVNGRPDVARYWRPSGIMRREHAAAVHHMPLHPGIVVPATTPLEEIAERVERPFVCPRSKKQCMSAKCTVMDCHQHNAALASTLPKLPAPRPTAGEWQAADRGRHYIRSITDAGATRIVADCGYSSSLDWGPRNERIANMRRVILARRMEEVIRNMRGSNQEAAEIIRLLDRPLSHNEREIF